MAVMIESLITDIEAETADLRSLIAKLPDGPAGWDAPTPATGWAVRDQISHLAFFDDVAVRSATDPEGFTAEVLATLADGRISPDTIAERYRPMPGTGLLSWFDSARRALVAAFAAIDPSVRVPWFGLPMSAASSLTARIMETWAHGQDVADALGVTRVPSARLRHVAHIGVGARAFSYMANGLQVPRPGHRHCARLLPARHPAKASRRHRAGSYRSARRPVALHCAGIRRTSRPRAHRRTVRRRCGVRDPVRIGNCSGFYGDRIAAAREMVEGGAGEESIDVLCGDYLAELTMLILAKAQAKDPAGGYARTFLTQMEQVLGTCSDRGIKIVANAGGLNPAGLAIKLRELVDRLGITVRVAHVEGDHLRGNLSAITPPVGEVEPVSANAYTTTPPTSASAFGVYRPAAVPRSSATHVVVLPDGERRRIADPPTGSVPAAKVAGGTATAPPTEPTCRAPLGAVLGARSCDKGGNANIGLWARDDAGYAWACEHLTVERLRGLLGPEAAQLRIERFELPNLRALNVVVHGLLGDGVASPTRPDPQAKGLGDYLRSRIVDIPQSLLRACDKIT